jgi:hypothetical protein
MLTPAGQEPTPAIFITAAMLTGVAESSVYCPTELIKTRMQTMHAGTQVCAKGQIGWPAPYVQEAGAVLFLCGGLLISSIRYAESALRN